MHGDVPAPAGPLERGDRGLALEKALGQEIDHALGGMFVADGEAGAVGGGGEGGGHEGFWEFGGVSKGLAMKSFSVALIAVVVSTAAVAGPSMTVVSTQTTLSQEDCMARAESAMRNAGLTEYLESVGKTVFGEKGEYTAAIRCESANTMVIFVVSGPDEAKTDQYNDDLSAAF